MVRAGVGVPRPPDYVYCNRAGPLGVEVWG